MKELLRTPKIEAETRPHLQSSRSRWSPNGGAGTVTGTAGFGARLSWLSVPYIKMTLGTLNHPFVGKRGFQ
jgi:hypothetical protein